MDFSVPRLLTVPAAMSHTRLFLVFLKRDQLLFMAITRPVHIAKANLPHDRHVYPPLSHVYAKELLLNYLWDNQHMLCVTFPSWESKPTKTHNHSFLYVPGRCFLF